MADAIAQVVDERVTVTIYGADLLAPLLLRAEDAAEGAEGSEAAAVASAAAAATSAAGALVSEETAGQYLDAIEAVVDGESIDAALPLEAVSRAVMAAFTGMSAGRQVYLSEAGRAGVFKWSTANHAADVTADPRQGIYVPPASDTDGSSGAWVRVLEDDDLQASWWGLAVDGIADDQPAIQAALDCELGSIIDAPAGRLGINAQLIIPSGKWFRGRGAGETIITPLATYAPRTAGFNQAITCSNTSSNVKCTDMTWDGNKVGLGGGAGQRICGFVPSGTDFYFARLTAIDTSGYGVWPFGKDDATRCSGLVEDVISTNADIHFESSKADGVKFVRCEARIGDGDFPNTSAFHPYDGSSNIEYIDCSAEGAFSSPVHIIADTRDIRIKLLNCEISTDFADAAAIQPGGAFATELEIIGGRFISEAGTTVTVADGVTLRATATKFQGYQFGVVVSAGGVAEFGSVRITAETPDDSDLSTVGLYNDGTATVAGASHISAMGTPGFLLATGGTVSVNLGSGVTLDPEPAGTVTIRQQTAGQLAPTADGVIGSDNIYIVDVVSPYVPADSDKCHISVSLHDTAETDTALGSPSFSSKWAYLPGVSPTTFRVRIRTPASLTGINVAYHFIEWLS